MSEEQRSNETQKNPNPLKWRLQYGRRPPKKTDEQRTEEQKMIENFLKNRPESEETPEIPKKSTNSSNSRDQKLVAKFLEKRVTSAN